MNISVILAAGTGMRMQSAIPKQFIPIAGKMVIEHTLLVFQQHPLIDEICIVKHEKHCAYIEPIIRSKYFTKIKKIISGGTYRTDSTQAAINAYTGDLNLIIHDAARPMVTERIITDTIKNLSYYNAIAVAIPTVDTVMQCENDLIQQIPDRELLLNAQTPQGFKHETLKRAYQLMLADGKFTATDDCAIVRKYLPNEKIFVVRGESTNIKLTDQKDLFTLEHLLKMRSQ